MRFCVIQHPEAGAGISAESALSMWEAHGWTRTSGWADDPAVFNTSGQVQIPEIYALDAPAPGQPEPSTTQAGPASEPVSKSKEN